MSPKKKSSCTHNPSRCYPSPSSIGNTLIVDAFINQGDVQATLDEVPKLVTTTYEWGYWKRIESGVAL